MKLGFERWDDGRWFVILPNWDGDQEDLEMVEGADKMLDALTDDGLLVTLKIFQEDEGEPSGKYFTLEMESHDDFGAYYNVIGCDRFQGTIWLCNVTHAVFGEHPELLYCKVVDY